MQRARSLAHEKRDYGLLRHIGPHSIQVAHELEVTCSLCGKLNVVLILVKPLWSYLFHAVGCLGVRCYQYQLEWQLLAVFRSLADGR